MSAFNEAESRVLVVDDEPGVRQLVRRMLSDLHVVETDGVGALPLLRSQSFDVVLLDLFMPDVDGFELLRALRQEFPDIKVVAMSGGALGGTVDLLSNAPLLGAKEVLRKPFGEDALRVAIARALA